MASLALGLLWGPGVSDRHVALDQFLYALLQRLVHADICRVLLALRCEGLEKWVFWLVVIGLNPLTIYIVQELFVFSRVSVIFAGGLANHAGVYRVLVMAVATVATKWLFLYFLYHRKIFLKA